MIDFDKERAAVESELRRLTGEPFSIVVFSLERNGRILIAVTSELPAIAAVELVSAALPLMRGSDGERVGSFTLNSAIDKAKSSRVEFFLDAFEPVLSYRTT